MATGIMKAWSTTAASNASADSAINWAEGMTPAAVNNSARAEMAAVKAFANQILGAKTSGGSANAQTFTSDAPGAISTAYAAGMGFVFKAGYSNTGACTFNADGVGAKSIKKGGAQAALAANDIVANGIYFLVYEASGDCFLLLNPESGQIAAQPLDATLTAVAALSWSTGKPLVQFTAADTVSLTLAPDVTSVTVGLGSASAPSMTFSGDTNTGIYSPGADSLSIVCAGSAQIGVGNGYVTFVAPMFIPDGSAASPGLSYGSDTDCGWYRIGANNLGLALNGTKYLDASTTLFDFSTSVRAKLAVSSETTGTLTAASSNKKVNASGNITIDGNVHAANDQIKIYAGASARTLTQGATGTPTQRLHGSSTTGNLTLAARGVAVVDFISATEWVISGDVS